MRKFITGVAIAALLAALVALFYNAVLFQGLILGDYDAFVYFYPLREYAANSLKQGRFPLWNPYLFLGSPFFANVQTAVLYPLNALFLVLSTPYAYTASIVAHVFLATRYVSVLPANLGCLVASRYRISDLHVQRFLSGQVGYINQLNVSAWLPLLVTFDEEFGSAA